MKKSFQFVHRWIDRLKRALGRAHNGGAGHNERKEDEEARERGEPKGLVVHDPEPFDSIPDFPSIEELRERNQHEIRKRRTIIQSWLALFVIGFSLIAHFSLILYGEVTKTNLDAAKYFWTGVGPIVGIFAKMIWDAWRE